MVQSDFYSGLKTYIPSLYKISFKYWMPLLVIPQQ